MSAYLLWPSSNSEDYICNNPEPQFPEANHSKHASENTHSPSAPETKSLDAGLGRAAIPERLRTFPIFWLHPDLPHPHVSLSSATRVPILDWGSSWKTPRWDGLNIFILIIDTRTLFPHKATFSSSRAKSTDLSFWRPPSGHCSERLFCRSCPLISSSQHSCKEETVVPK